MHRPRVIEHLADIAGGFDAIVFDQWGVLHDGSAPYPGALACLSSLRQAGACLAVLSNSGKRAAPNAARIAAMGGFRCVMTSGEALWTDLAADRLPYRSLCPVERAPGDAADWAEGLAVTLTPDPDRADAVLLMGLPDDASPGAYEPVLDAALRRALPVLCSNPDLASPRAGGRLVTSPGALAQAHAARGGQVHLYGKPHLPVFRAVEAALNVPPARILMVGDSLDHDIRGAQAAGWATAFVEGGLYAGQGAGSPDVLARLVAKAGCDLPDYSLPQVA
ncbi:MAG: TIGR01459 family HAD-type hydrolase [Cypionkella sp.]|nr:TIGR01459 family HAD-type hydrolase [Cypionkella sp.]